MVANMVGNARRDNPVRAGSLKGPRKSAGKPPQGFTIRLCDNELYWARVTLLNIDDSVEVVEVSGFFGGSSCTVCFALLRLRHAGGLTTGAGASSAFMERR